MGEKRKVVMIPYDRAPYITSVSDSLENLQKIVGGYIELLSFASDGALVMNEEGKIIGLPLNRTASLMFGIPIVGDTFLIGINGEEFDSLSDEVARWFLKEAKGAWGETE